MTTREEIREGVAKLLIEPDIGVCDLEVAKWHLQNWKAELPDKILQYLDSKGVVLRKDGHVEFNLTGIPPTPTQMSEISKAYKEAGYEAVASLI